MDTEVRWTVKVSKDTDILLRTFLAQRGMKKGDLSKFIEQAVRERVANQLGEVGGGDADLAKRIAIGAYSTPDAGYPPPLFFSELAAPIAALCRRFGVQFLAVFGSALCEDFDRLTSDVDLAVEFVGLPGKSLSRQYFDFKQGIKALIERSVDLVELPAMPATRLRRIIERTQVQLYRSEAA